jgi:hypothetical protein
MSFGSSILQASAPCRSAFYQRAFRQSSWPFPYQSFGRGEDELRHRGA